MLIKAEQKYFRTSARKVRLLADLVRRLTPDAALEQLSLSPKYASLPLKKTLRQAMANAVNTKNLDPKTLVIDSILVNEGPTYKRWQPVSRGRAHPIKKRTCHITVILKGTPHGTKS